MENQGNSGVKNGYSRVWVKGWAKGGWVQIFNVLTGPGLVNI